MFGSQALETAIGLILMFFVVSLGASAIVEIWSRLTRKRAADLERAISRMLAGSDAADPDLQAALATFKGTTVYDGLMAGAGKSSWFNPMNRGAWKQPSYLSAHMFASAVAEIADSAKELPPALQKRLDAITRTASTTVMGVQAEIEGWFDSVMERVEGAYKRWVTAILFVVGLVIAIIANASAYDTAQSLWSDPVTRAAVADSAPALVERGGDLGLASIAKTVDALDETGLPVGWTEAARAEWSDAYDPRAWTTGNVATLLGWVATALLVTLGAPFWFDLLTRLVSLRSSGAKPPVAAEDPMSATMQMTRAAERPAPAPPLGTTIDLTALEQRIADLEGGDEAGGPQGAS